MFAIVGRSIRNGISSPSTRRLQLGLDARLLLLVLARDVAHVALARELPQLARAPVAVHGQADLLRRLELRQLRVALVDRDEVEPLLEPGVVVVVLLVELGDEAVGGLADAVELALGGGRGLRHGRVG